MPSTSPAGSPTGFFVQMLPSPCLFQMFSEPPLSIYDFQAFARWPSRRFLKGEVYQMRRNNLTRVNRDRSMCDATRVRDYQSHGTSGFRELGKA